MASQEDLIAKIAELLEEHRVMTVSTLRSDGWPQATMVGYVRDGLTLYFAAAVVSQKVANIQRDSRVSIALGHEEPTRLRGLSIAARAEVVGDTAEIDAVNALLRERYREQTRFSPRETASVLVRATPVMVSIIDLGKGPGAEPELISVSSAVPPQAIRTVSRTGEALTVPVHFVATLQDGYRPGAPPEIAFRKAIRLSMNRRGRELSALREMPS